MNKYKKYHRHGLSKHPLYKIYYGIINRCRNKNEKCYKHYGKRGIICEWETFISFYEDMKDNYRDGLEIDRIDVNGNYCKANCRWATRKEQMNNYRNNIVFTHKNKKYKLSEFSEKFNINRSTLKNRVKLGITGDDLTFKGNLPHKIINEDEKTRLINGKTILEISAEIGITREALGYRIKKYGVEGAITKPVDKHKGVIQPKLFFDYFGKKYTLTELSKKFNIKRGTLWRRLYTYNMSLDKALNKKI